MRGKKVLLKHPTEKMNFSQKKRVAFFIQRTKNICEIYHDDGEKIAEAVINRDPEKASKFMEEHLRSVEKDVLNKVLKNQD